MSAPLSPENKTDREAEAWVRQNSDHRLPDVRRGRNANKTYAVDPRDGEHHFGDQSERPETSLSGIDAAVHIRRGVSVAPPTVDTAMRIAVTHNGKRFMDVCALDDVAYKKQEAEP
jgi:hypothetical protein